MNTKKDSLKDLNIRPLNIEDYDFILKWSKDDRFCTANGWECSRNETELYNWWLKCVTNSSSDFIRMGIEWKERLIGYADLAYIKNNTAELGIAIGESSLWGKGIGTHASVLFMKYAAERFGITVFNAETHEENQRSQKLLEKIGFKEISRVGSEEYLGMQSLLIQYRLTMD